MWRSVRPSLNLPQLLWSVPLLWYRLISLVSFIAFYIVICLSACCFFGIRTCVSLFSLLHSLCRVVDISSAARWHRYAFSLVDTFRFLSIFNSHCFWIALIGRSKVCRVLKNAKICWAYSINFFVVVVDFFWFCSATWTQCAWENYIQSNRCAQITSWIINICFMLSRHLDQRAI